MPAGRSLRTHAGHYSRIRGDATISIARITLSDSDPLSNGASQYRNFARGGRLVTAGDGNMVSVGHMGHPRQGSLGSGRHYKERRIAVLVQEERPTHVRTYTRGRAAADAGGGCHDVSCRPQDRHAVGEGWETNVNPHAGGTPALP